MRVLFLNPPFLPRYSRSQRSPGVIRSGTLYYPIWLAYAAGMTEREGHETRLVDCPARGANEEDILADIKSWRPDIVFCDTSTPSSEYDLGLAEKIQLERPESWVFPVGTHVTATYEESLNAFPRLPGVCLGEYDLTVLDLCAKRKAGESPCGVTGTAVREGERIVVGPARPPLEDLDSLPWASKVYRRHLRIEDYFYSITRHPVLTIITGRGCPFRCMFCLYPQVMHGHKYRTRSPESVTAEFEYIHRELPKVREVFIEDDTFTVDKQRVRLICESLIRIGNRLPWTANARADVDEETLFLMRRAGCRLLCVGFESADDNLLKKMQKAQVVDRMRRFREDARKAGIMIHGCFLVGGPGETRETMRASLDLAKNLSCDTAQFFPIMVYPGTAAFDWAKDNGFLQTTRYRDWLTESGQHRCVVTTPDLSAEELMRFCDEARREYYLSPRYWTQILRTLVRHPSEAKRVFMAFRTFARHLLPS